MESKAREEVVLARVQTGEADPCDDNEAGLLREHLDVGERFEQRHVLTGGREDPRRGTGEESLQREPAARVPQVTGDEASAAFRTLPERAVRHAATVSRGAANIGGGQI